MTTLAASTGALTPNATSIPAPSPNSATLDWRKVVNELGPRFAVRAADYDDSDRFVADNYVDLKAARMFSAGVPTNFGGGGASYTDLCEIIRLLAHSDGSTALALSMHYHLIAALVWKWRNVNAPVGPVLEKVAREQLVLVSSGGSDWLHSSGTAEAVDGGFRVNARKIFSSGSVAGDLLMTSAVFEDPQAGPTVLHFSLPLRSAQVKVLSNWHTLGMRGTGSNDVLIENAFVPESSVSARRPRGRWHPALHVVSKIALPMVYAAYVGLAETAREIALAEIRDKRDRPETQLLVGEMETELFSSRLAHGRMVELANHSQPGPETTNAIMMARVLTAQAAIRTVDKAVELVGGRSYFRSHRLERIWRDAQAARFHPVVEKPQQQFAGRLALGVDLDAA